MVVTLPADLTKQVEQELASGRYRSRDELIERAIQSRSSDSSESRCRNDAALNSFRS